ncbi:MAG: hypothetical protein J5780_03300, partial [Treponema sp.]|nr:hypothetical protein [Treponema sp.]
KTLAVKAAADAGDYSLCIRGMDFAIENAAVLDDDKDTEELLNECILNVNKSQAADENEISSRLCTIFKTYSSREVKINVLSKFSKFPSPAAVSIVNSFISESIQKATPVNDAVRNSMTFLKANGNNTSFRLLFVADIINVWPEEKKLLSETWGPLANNSGTEILQLLSGASNSEKLSILEAVRKNLYVSKKIRGEVAENALSQAIYNVDDSSRTVIDLQLSALQAIADARWTQASELVTSYFLIARNEYEQGWINAEEFSSVISSSVKVASSKTGEVLSGYLDALNGNMEAKNVPEKAVVLSVINALGGLGDKTAFDSLLYVTYLDYPEEVTIAARNALAKLKW